MRNLYFIIIIIFFATSCNKKEEAVFVNTDEIPTLEVEEIIPLPEKEWTYLFYNDADFNGFDPLVSFTGLVSSDSVINYLVLRDAYESGAAYYHINENNIADELQLLGEVNMGSAVTLRRFIDFAKKYFPAKRYIIAFYDHGGGWKGACWDETNENDNLTLSEMNTVISEKGGVDLVFHTAPCLMGCLEATYQMRNSVKYFVASENTSLFIYWDKMLNDFDSYIKTNPFVESRILAEEVVKMHKAHISETDYGDNLTMSAIDLSMINNFVLSFNKVIDYYRNQNNKFVEVLNTGVQTYSKDYIDVKDLLEKLYKSETDLNAKQLLTEAIQDFENCILQECHGVAVPGSNGLNVYCPAEMSFPQIYFPPYGTDLNFKTDCDWDLLVKQSK